MLQLTLETGEIGRQANGAVMARLGDTVSRQPEGEGRCRNVQQCAHGHID